MTGKTIKIILLTMTAVSCLFVGLIALIAIFFFDAPSKWSAYKKHQEALVLSTENRPVDALKAVRVAIDLHPTSGTYRLSWIDIQKRVLDKLKRSTDIGGNPLDHLERVATIATRIDMRELEDRNYQAIQSIHKSASNAACIYLSNEWQSGGPAVLLRFINPEDAPKPEWFIPADQEWFISLETQAGYAIAISRLLEDQQFEDATNLILSIPAGWQTGPIDTYANKISDTLESISSIIVKAEAEIEAENYLQARELLGSIQDYQNWVPRIQKLNQTISERGERALFGQLIRAIKNSSSDSIRNAYADLEHFKGERIPLSADLLISPGPFDQFLRQLQDTGLSPMDDKDRKDFKDILMVGALYEKFDTPADATRFLTKGYNQWAYVQLMTGKIGHSQYITLLCLNIDPDNEAAQKLNRISKELIKEQFAVKVHSAPTANQTPEETPKIAKTLEDFAQSLASEANAAISSTPTEAPLSLEFRILPTISSINTKIEMSEEQLKVLVKTGTTASENPAYTNAQYALNSAIAKRNQAQTELANVQAQNSANQSIASYSRGASGWAGALSGLSSGLSTTAVSLAQQQVNEADAEVRNAQLRLQNIPRTISSDTYGDHYYPKRLHTTKAELSFHIHLIGPDNRILASRPGSIERVFTTTEVQADPQNGIAPEFPKFVTISDIESSYIAEGLERELENIRSELLSKYDTHISKGLQSYVDQSGLPPESRNDLWLCLIFNQIERNQELAQSLKTNDLLGFFGRTL